MIKKLYECGCFDYKKFIMDNFKNYLAIDWDKALEPVEE